MNQTPVYNLRSMSLEKLKSLKSSTSIPVYAGLIKKTIKGRELSILRGRFLAGKIADHSKEYDYQGSLIDFLQDDLKKAEKDIRDEQQFIEKKVAERQQAYDEFLKAKDKLEKADQALEATKLVMEKFQSDFEAIEKAISIAEQRKDEIDTIVLVHRTANLGQLMDYNFGKVVVTETDADFFKELLIPDEVFDRNLGEGLIGELPYHFRNLSEDALKSIIQFAEMAMYYYLLEEKQVIMLYADNDIAAILKKEGME